MRSSIVATFLSFAALAASPAVALAAPGSAPAQVAHEKGDKPSFPMPAAAFKQRVDTRTTKARERMEKHASKLGAEEAKQLRAKFDAGVAQVNAEVAKATADGTVTKDEAQKVREVARALRGHHGKHAKRHGKSDGR